MASDYSKLVKALRCELHGVPCNDENCGWLWHGGGCCDEVRLMVDAADAIERLVSLYEKAEMDATNLTGELAQTHAYIAKLKKSIQELQGIINEVYP